MIFSRNKKKKKQSVRAQRRDTNSGYIHSYQPDHRLEEEECKSYCRGNRGSGYIPAECGFDRCDAVSDGYNSGNSSDSFDSGSFCGGSDSSD